MQFNTIQVEKNIFSQMYLSYLSFVQNLIFDLFIFKYFNFTTNYKKYFVLMSLVNYRNKIYFKNNFAYNYLKFKL